MFSFTKKIMSSIFVVVSLISIQHANASGSSPVRHQPGGYEQVRPIFIPGSEEDMQTPGHEHYRDAERDIRHGDQYEPVQPRHECLLMSDRSEVDVCIGDKVVSRYGHKGKVIGINKSNNTVAIDLNDYSSHVLENVYQIYQGESGACVDGFCVGQRVVSKYGYPGTIIGVNPKTKYVAIDIDSYSSHVLEGIDTIYMGQ